MSHPRRRHRRRGRVQDLCGHTALSIAMMNERKPIVRLLLRAIVSR